MGWLHTWSGLLLGTLLFTVFFMGTLTVFNAEIDRWMQPETRFSADFHTAFNHDDILELVGSERPDATFSRFSISMPEARRPFVVVYAQHEDGEFELFRLDPKSGALLPEAGSYGGTGFFYQMHIRLFMPGVAGWWIVMFAGLAMMLLVITGVIIHRKIISDFFTFRPEKKLRRSSLDLHNLTGVVFLPFHFMIALSGLMIFSGWYSSIFFSHLPGESGKRVAELLYSADEYGVFARDALGEPAGEIVPVAPLVDQAEAIWTARYGEPASADYVDLRHMADANGYVAIRRVFPDRRVEQGVDKIVFDLSSGEQLADFQPTAVRSAQKWIAGLHFIQFEHWPLRWLYFMGGLAGCMMIATGFIFWTAARRKKGKLQPFKVRLVECISVGSTIGVVVATGVFLVVNRLLPNGAAAFGLDRAQLEVGLFFLAWILAFVHAGFRKNASWADQAWVLAALCISAVLLNWATTGDHLVATTNGRLWAVAGVDLVLLTSAALAVWSASRLRRRGRVRTDSRMRLRGKPVIGTAVE